MAGLRVVLDTNVLVFGLAYPASIPGRIFGVWRQRGLNLTLSRYILDEMVRMLPRLRQVSLNAQEIRDLADTFKLMADVVEPSERVEELRDDADQLVLGTLRTANADYFITGDKNLLALAAQFSIGTPVGFWERHGS